MIATQPEMTVEEFERFAESPANAHPRLEMVDGVIVEKSMPTELHGAVAVNIVFATRLYLREHRIGRVFIEARYRPDDGTPSSRVPDIAIRLGNEPMTTRGGHVRYPELVFEIQSPNDRLKAMRETAQHYLAHGTQVVILVITSKKTVIVLSLDEELLLTLDDTLTLEDILPGFSLPVADIFSDPLTEA